MTFGNTHLEPSESSHPKNTQWVFELLEVSQKAGQTLAMLLLVLQQHACNHAAVRLRAIDSVPKWNPTHECVVGRPSIRPNKETLLLAYMFSKCEHKGKQYGKVYAAQHSQLGPLGKDISPMFFTLVGSRV